MCCSFPQVNWAGSASCMFVQPSPSAFHHYLVCNYSKTTFLRAFCEENKPQLYEVLVGCVQVENLVHVQPAAEHGEFINNHAWHQPRGLRQRKWDPGAVREAMPALPAQPGARSQSPAHIQHCSAGNFGDRNGLLIQDCFWPFF